MTFSRSKQSKSDAIIGLDLGRSQVKAVVVKRQGAGLTLAEYGVRKLPAPADKPLTSEQLGQELQQLMGGMKIQDRRAYVAVSCDSAMVCHAEFPRMPLDEIRRALKLNSARYLRRDYSNYYLDAVELVDDADGVKKKKTPKMNVLVGGASKEDVAWYRDALIAAKIRPEAMDLAAVSVVNAFQVSHPELCQKEAVLLVDIGAHSSSMSFLRNGLPVLTRITQFGGLQLSEFIGQMLTLSQAEAEEEKIKMSEPVQPLVKTAVATLAKEIRSSIDFFERQQECHVAAVFACGGSASSDKLLEFLSEQAGVRVELWNPIHNFDISHFNGEGKLLTAAAPNLAAAIGAAAARL